MVEDASATGTRRAPKRDRFRVAVMPGDGIGVEVVDATLRILRAMVDDGLPLALDRFEWPSTAHHRETGACMPDDWRARLEGYDAMLLGALGDPGPLDDPNRYVLPDSISLAPLLRFRRDFDLWACERPALSLPGAPQYLADERAKELDLLVIRENSEGEYIGQGGRIGKGRAHEVATQVSVFTRFGTERIIRHAFRRALSRADEREKGLRRERRFSLPDGGEARAQVCLVTKRNALAYWGELYTEVFAEVAAEFPNVAVHHELVDAACMKFVACPWRFDVVVASNLQGDILTDLAAVLSGGMGVAPSSNVNPADRKTPPMFEPTHGSGPDIAGKGVADPRAMTLTAALMLDWMGEESPPFASAGRRLRDAVAKDLEEASGERRSTTEITDAILERL